MKDDVIVMKWAARPPALYLRVEGKSHTKSEVDESQGETHNEIDRSKDITEMPTGIG